MESIDNWHICNKCGKEYENWCSRPTTRTSRCLACANVESRRRYGYKQPKRACKLCDTMFLPPDSVGKSTLYCDECRHLGSYERKIALARKNGLPGPKQRYKPKKVVVDNTRLVKIQSVMNWRVPLEKFLETYNDKRVRFVG